MTYAGARGETAEEMAKALHFTQGHEWLHPTFAGLNGQLQKDDPKKKLQKHVNSRDSCRWEGGGVLRWMWPRAKKGPMTMTDERVPYIPPFPLPQPRPQPQIQVTITPCPATSFLIRLSDLRGRAAVIRIIEDTCQKGNTTIIFRRWEQLGYQVENRRINVKLGDKKHGDWRCDSQKGWLFLSIDTIDVLALYGIGSTCTPKKGDKGDAAQLRLFKDGLKPPITWERM